MKIRTFTRAIKGAEGLADNQWSFDYFSTIYDGDFTCANEPTQESSPGSQEDSADCSSDQIESAPGHQDAGAEDNNDHYEGAHWDQDDCAEDDGDQDGDQDGCAENSADEEWDDSEWDYTPRTMSGRIGSTPDLVRGPDQPLIVTGRDFCFPPSRGHGFCNLDGCTAVMVDSMLWHTLASCWRCHLQAQKMTFAVELATLLSVLQKPWTRSLRATRRSWLTVCFGTLWLRAGGVTCMLKRFTFAVELATLLSVLQKPWTRSLRGARVNNFFFPAAMVWSRGRDERQRQAVVAELELPVRLTQLALTTFSFQQPWFGAAAETSDSGRQL
jgi:hypothetical protein